MARQRKGKTSNAIPETHPSEVPPRLVPEKPLIDIPEEEKWRLINESGILKSSSLKEVSLPENLPIVVQRLSLSDEIFNAALLVIPFSSLLLLMEILIRHQYGKSASMEVIMDRMVPGVPILSLFIFYTSRYKQTRVMQFFLFVLSVLVGSRMLYQYHNASWLIVMQQAPPLATVWIYTIVQLDLSPAVASLLTIGTFMWWKEMKIL